LLGLQEDYAVTREQVLALVDRESSLSVQSWAMTFAMNPLPPAKLSNDRLRIEMEQTVPVGQMIERANATREHPDQRQLYLRILARASVREGGEQQELLAFYRTLKSEQERALILPAAATTLEAFPDLWEAFSGVALLQNAAVEGLGNLVKLRVKSFQSAEETIRSTTRSLSSVNRFAAEIANRLLEKIVGVGPQDKRVATPLRAMDALPLPQAWSINEGALTTLLSILENRPEPPIRRRVLRLILNLNSHLERFHRSIKDEALDRMIFFGENSLRRAVTAYIEHYHRERNHQGLGNRIIEPGDEVGRGTGSIHCRERLGGLLQYYYRDAA